MDAVSPEPTLEPDEPLDARWQGVERRDGAHIGEIEAIGARRILAVHDIAVRSVVEIGNRIRDCVSAPPNPCQNLAA